MFYNRTCHPVNSHDNLRNACKTLPLCSRDLCDFSAAQNHYKTGQLISLLQHLWQTFCGFRCHNNAQSRRLSAHQHFGGAMLYVTASEDATIPTAGGRNHSRQPLQNRYPCRRRATYLESNGGRTRATPVRRCQSMRYDPRHST